MELLTILKDDQSTLDGVVDNFKPTNVDWMKLLPVLNVNQSTADKVVDS